MQTDTGTAIQWHYVFDSLGRQVTHSGSLEDCGFCNRCRCNEICPTCGKVK